MKKLKMSELSQSEFGCCSFASFCDYGKETCFYIEKENDEAYAKQCTIYRRQQGLIGPPIGSEVQHAENRVKDVVPVSFETETAQQEELPSLIEEPVKEEKKEEENQNADENGQFSLF